jgi:abortive infection bacteriophage resistance protein
MTYTFINIPAAPRTKLRFGNRVPGRVLYFKDLMTLFPKPALCVQEQIKKLEDRGLIISNRNSAEHYLTYIGYYHFSAYSLYFQTTSPEERPSIPDKQFRSEIKFEDILNLYIFDRELRLLVMDAIERIEVAFRACIVNEMSLKYGAHWYMQVSCFTTWFRHAEFILSLEKEYNIERDPRGKPIIGEQHHETFINHYFKTYTEPYLPPAWMVGETLSIGKWSLLFKHIQDSGVRKAVATKFGMDEFYLKNFMHTLTYIRNLCAHHARLWNRKVVIKPISFRRQKDLKVSNDRMAAQIVIIYDLLKIVAPDSRWLEKLRNLIDQYKPDLVSMGFSQQSAEEFFERLIRIESTGSPKGYSSV